MKAPRLPSPFRNVRQAPRSFTFRSSHVDARALRWKERREAIEAELGGTSEEAPRKLRFRQGVPTGVDRGSRVRLTRLARRRAMVRSGAILVVLLYAAWQGLLWVEQTDFAREFLIVPEP